MTTEHTSFRLSAPFKMFITFIFGFSSGLPLLATGSTLQAWMKDEGVDLTTIGLFALAGIPYTLKFLWAPLFDRFTVLPLGRRRGWILITQVALLLSFFWISTTTPSITPWTVALITLLLCFFSASQDIVLDAHRRDLLADNELGLGSTLFVAGYRVGLITSGAVALSLADSWSWHNVYMGIGMCMCVGIVATFFAPEPESHAPPPRTLREAVIEPLREYFTRPRAIYLLVFILMFKLGDQMASAMWVPFSLEQGYTKPEIALFGKTFGLIAMLFGGLAGGAILLRLNMMRGLLIFGVLQAVSTLGFSLLSLFPPNQWLFGAVVGFENITSGMGTAAFTAYTAYLCDRRFSATQYALLTSLLGVPRTILSAPTGWLASYLGWFGFFGFCTIAAVPGLLMLQWLIRRDPGERRSF